MVMTLFILSTVYLIIATLKSIFVQGWIQEIRLGAHWSRVSAGDEPRRRRRRGDGVREGVYPLPSRLRGLGERRKLPQRGLGQSPSRKRCLSISCSFFAIICLLLLILEAEYHAITKLRRHHWRFGRGGGTCRLCPPLDPPLCLC